jgi:hypothetical protein
MSIYAHELQEDAEQVRIAMAKIGSKFDTPVTPAVLQSIVDQQRQTCSCVQTSGVTIADW